MIFQMMICLGVTKKGTKCTHKVKPNETFCGFHRKVNNKTLSPRPSTPPSPLSSSVASTDEPIVPQRTNSLCKHYQKLQEDLKDNCKDLSLIQTHFQKCVKGYHLINSSVINETIWEDINVLVFASLGIEIVSKSDGSHLSGMDINCSLGRISNKSAKYNNGCIDISSYRLTNVCSDKNVGTVKDILQEINKRKNFDYYSFIVREEKRGLIHYDWYLIPSDYTPLNPSSYTWKPTIGKRGKGVGAQVGWNTDEIDGCKMSISFSMSSQLWIHLKVTDALKQFIIASTEVSNQPKYNYMQIADLL
jgi:hypothetical protein